MRRFCAPDVLASGDFNPRTRVGCDPDAYIRFLLEEPFQSTHPRRVRLGVKSHFRSISDFNPRTRVGCDGRGAVLNTLLNRYFNPRTRVGCDATCPRDVSDAIQFQSTHPRRVRPVNSLALPGVSYFNPRTRVGCDRRWLTEAHSLPIFQSTHPRRVRHCSI